MDAIWILTMLVLIDMVTTNLYHQANVRARVPENKVITVALMVAIYFVKNHRIALNIIQQLHDVLGLISHSRLKRQLQSLCDWMSYLLGLLSDMLSSSAIYIIDSISIPVCRHVQAKRCTKVAGTQYAGKCCAKNEHYCGWKPHLVCDSSVIPIHFVVRPARIHDTTAVDDLVCTVPFGTVLFGDRCYGSESICYQLDSRYYVTMIVIHRANMQPNTPAEQRILRMHRKRTETCISQLEKVGVARIYARLVAGVLLKVATSLCALSVSSYR